MIQPGPQQRKAIEAPLGPVLVVAGPGAGKTFCLINRIRFLVTRQNVAAQRICAVTFTNKAAEEIGARLDSEIGAPAQDVRTGTIHSLCADILREHAGAAGLRPGFGIADEEYQRIVLRQLGQARRAGDLLGLFCRRRISGYRLTPGDEQLFLDYQQILRRRNMVDFDDLVAHTAALFEQEAAVARDVAAKWSYLLVDEFQDVNALQYAILRRLAEPHRNIFAVGDDEQSIFSWAGADPQVLKRFQTDYDIASSIVLDRNHRCSQQIFTVARRLLAENPSLFDKDLTATRLSTHEVEVSRFADDDAEADWLLADIARDRQEYRQAHPDGGFDWGDYGVLYRKHEIGDRLEARFLRAGLPCQLAKGHAASDDPVIGYVMSALRLVVNPQDGAAAESFARRVLPPHLMQRVEAEIGGPETDFLRAARDTAGMLGRDPDAKKLWRLIYQVENLAALRGKHESLTALIEELLSQRVGVYRNPLEDRHHDLSDPLDLPAAAALAGRLGAARTAVSRIVLEDANGLEIGLRGMLFGAGYRRVLYAGEVEQAEFDDLRIGPPDAGTEGLALTLFKALQAAQAHGMAGGYRSYVSFDLETTDLDPQSCGIVEIAAVRVIDGRPAGEFHSLVRPDRPVSAGASKVHGYSDATLAGEEPFAAVWPRFKAFAGPLPLVAHNGHRFDVPVLRRLAAAAEGAPVTLDAFDTLPLAQSLQGDSARLGDLAARFGIALERAHHALDDARALAGVYEALEHQRVVRARKSGLVNLLPYLGLSLALDRGRKNTDEVQALAKLTESYALGRFSDCLEFYEAERGRGGRHGPSLEEVIERLGGRSRMESLREERDAASRYPAAVARLQALIEQRDGEGLDAAIERLLERVALSAKSGPDVEQHRVNLLTLHSTKGLEFSRVYIIGVEDEQLPGWIKPGEDRDQQIQEARRLLYVGMTRACDRLVLTRVERRNGKPGGDSTFLEEMGLAPQTAAP